MDTTAFSTKSFKNIHSRFTIHKTKTSNEIKFSVFSLFLRKFFSAQVSRIRKIEPFKVDINVSILDLFD